MFKLTEIYVLVCCSAILIINSLDPVTYLLGIPISIILLKILILVRDGYKIK